MNKADRELRDARVMELFYAGFSYRAIAEDVGLRSKSSVGQIVERSHVAAPAVDRRDLLTDEAQAVWLERFERLWNALQPKALEGDRYATGECRRMLAQWVSVFGLSRPVTLADTGRLEVDVDDAVEAAPDAMDELARLRYNRAMGLPPNTRYDAS